MTQSYFFTQDDEGHWYMLPVELRDLWFDLSWREDAAEQPRWKEIEVHRVNGSICDITFENPKEVW